MNKYKTIISAIVLIASTPLAKAQDYLYTTGEDDLRTWLEYFVSPECRGRLTGDVGFDRAADYAANLFQEWGLKPGGDNGTYFQNFEHPYTEVFPGGSFTLYLPVGNDWVTKTYDYPDNYMAGGTSDTGELNQLDLVYVGYGVTAPELNYDDYKGIDVKGKIVVCERDVPYQEKDPAKQKAWMPYQYHTHKMKNAVDHGAAGMLYVTTTANPNPGWNEGFVYACISDSVAGDIFAGTGKTHKAVKEGINKSLKPNSFKINKKADISAYTKFHPDGMGKNVIGVIPGSDPTLAPEVIVAGGHLDHVGMMPVLMPGALDNGSGSVIVMGAAKALATSETFKPKRTLVFILFGGEETGLIGSHYFAENPIVPADQIKTAFNIDCLGTGYGLSANAAQKYGTVLDYVESANDTYVKRPFRTGLGANEIITRPRTDGAVLFQQGIPVISLYSFGAETRTPYHHPGDVIELIDFNIVKDATKLLTTSLVNLSEADVIECNPAEPKK